MMPWRRNGRPCIGAAPAPRLVALTSARLGSDFDESSATPSTLFNSPRHPGHCVRELTLFSQHRSSLPGRQRTFLRPTPVTGIRRPPWCSASLVAARPRSEITRRNKLSNTVVRRRSAGGQNGAGQGPPRTRSCCRGKDTRTTGANRQRRARHHRIRRLDLHGDTAVPRHHQRKPHGLRLRTVALAARTRNRTWPLRASGARSSRREDSPPPGMMSAAATNRGRSGRAGARPGERTAGGCHHRSARG